MEGIALVPTISLNGNIYTAEEILSTENLNVPLRADWEHTKEVVGDVIYTLDESIPALRYKINVNTERAKELQEGVHKVSIEADVKEAVSSCNRVRCYNLVSGIKMEGIGITKTPGVTQVTATISESYQEWAKITEKSCKNCTVKINEEEQNDIKIQIEQLQKEVRELKTCKNCGKQKKFS